MKYLNSRQKENFLITALRVAILVAMFGFLLKQGKNEDIKSQPIIDSSVPMARPIVTFNG